MDVPEKLKSFLERFKQAWGRLNQKQKWMLGGATSVVFALVFTLVLFSTGDGGMVPVQSPVRDLSAAQAELSRFGIRSEFSTGSNDLLVPRDRRERAMLILNAARLLPNGLDHYAFLGETDFTSTEPQRFERIRVQVEELLRQTVQAMDGIGQASVRITPASREILFRPGSGQNKASVTVDLVGQSELTPQQVQSIASLVSASYPNLKAEDVFIHDTAGRPYVLRGDAQLTNDRFKLRRQVEADFEDKANRALAGFHAIVAATVEMRLIDEATHSITTFQPDGSEPHTAYLETSRERRGSRTERGTAGIRAESQNTNRTDEGRGETGNTEERSQLLERKALDEETRSELERMKLVIDYGASSLAVSLPEEIAESERHPAIRDSAANLVSRATGIAPDRIAIEFTPRAPIAKDGAMVNSLLTGGWLGEPGRLAGYAVLLVLIIAAFWVLNGLVKKTAPVAPADAEDDDTGEEEFTLPDLPRPGRANLESNLIYEKVNELVDDNPEAAANLLKRWILFNE
jgi:flagellar biosynthesis/type III secretory pathway M-ring protein FliF/YscJ